MLLGLCFMSCAKKPEPAPGPVVVPDAVLSDAAHAAQVRASIEDFLGKGYKGYQFYANPKSCTLPLFDLSASDAVSIQKAPSYRGRFVSGESLSEFYNAFSANISVSGSYNKFSGEITSNFTNSVLNNRSHSFIASHITQTYYRLILSDAAPLLPQVETDLQQMEPTQLWDKYGTHYLQSIYIGGRISFSSYIDRAKIEQGYDLEATVEAAYLEFVKGKASAGTVNKSVFDQVVRNREVDVMGGDPAKANSIMDGSGQASDAFNAWSASVPAYMSISDFADNGLIPIYELVADPERHALLKAAWTTYMADNTAAVLKQAPPKPVKKDAFFYLKSSDGRYYSQAPYNAMYSYYYPTIADKAQKLRFGGGAQTLKNNYNITIKTNEKFKDSITGKWSKYVYLGAFKLKHWVYYWTLYDAKTNWFIEKAVPAKDDQIYFGDAIRIRNEHFDQYLWPEKDGFMTTKIEPYTWIIEPAK